MVRRPLGRTGLDLSPIGFGAFKIGRNVGAKYPAPYELPSDEQVALLLRRVLDMGINYIDTAPAYGLSEERVGRLLPRDRGDLVISTKVGETFAAGRSRYDFSDAAVRASIDESRARLRTDRLDLVFIHAPDDDLNVMNSTSVVGTLQALRASGAVGFIGLSAKTTFGAQAALEWADAIMVEYHLLSPSMATVIAQAANRGVGVVVKKGLASGQLPADKAIPFVLGNPYVSSVVVGGLDADHVRANIAIAERV